MSAEYGLIFDVDGVIADSEAVNVWATAKTLDELFGIRGVRAEDFQAGVGRGAEEYVKAGARAHHRELSSEEVDAAVDIRQAYFLSILRDEELPAFSGVLELIASALKDKRFGLAIATSSTRAKSQAVLESAHVPYHTMVYVCGDDVTKKKPDPELFQLACRRLQLAPTHCAVVEDAPNGIAAACAAGCKSIAVTNTCERSQLRDATMVVDSLAEIDLSAVIELVRC